MSYGLGADATGDYSTAIGWSSEATKNSSLAVGNGARAIHTNSTAVGAGAYTTADNQIVLGNQNTTVYIPGNLWVAGNVELATTTGRYVSQRLKDGNRYGALDATGGGSPEDIRYWKRTPGEYIPMAKSDKRLKNIGEKYIAGTNELKKLDFYHFTFKKDETKTPHVGVMAQDLQKVFPDAVTKGDDGYLRIRFEDMFYAVINAVKELDAKITAFADDITGMKEEIKTLKEQNQKKKKMINDLEKRLSELEKNQTKN